MQRQQASIGELRGGIFEESLDDLPLALQRLGRHARKGRERMEVTTTSSFSRPDKHKEYLTSSSGVSARSWCVDLGGESGLEEITGASVPPILPVSTGADPLTGSGASLTVTERAEEAPNGDNDTAGSSFIPGGIRGVSKSGLPLKPTPKSTPPIASGRALATS